MFSRRGVLKKGRSRRLSLGRENTANSESRCNSVFSVDPLHAPTAESAVRHVSHRQGIEQGWANSWRLSPCFSMVAEPRSAFHFFCCCSGSFDAVIGGSKFWFGGLVTFFSGNVCCFRSSMPVIAKNKLRLLGHFRARHEASVVGTVFLSCRKGAI